MDASFFDYSPGNTPTPTVAPTPTSSGNNSNVNFFDYQPGAKAPAKAAKPAPAPATSGSAFFDYGKTEDVTPAPAPTATATPNLVDQAKGAAGGVIKQLQGVLTSIMPKAPAPVDIGNGAKLNFTTPTLDLGSTPETQSAKFTSGAMATTPEEKQKNLKETLNNFSQQMPQSTQAVQEIINDPMNKKADPGKIIPDVWDAFKTPAVEYMKAYLQSFQPGHSASEQTANQLKLITSAAGVVFSPINALFALAKDIPQTNVMGSTYASPGALTRILALPFLFAGEGAPKISNRIIDDLPLSDQSKATLKPAVGEVFALAAQIALGKFMEVTSKSVTGAVKTTSTDIFNNLTKDMITEVNAPKTVSLTGEQIRDIHQTGNLTSMQEKAWIQDLMKTGNLTPEQYIELVKKGSDLTVEIPKETIILMVDKPYWEKVKSFFGQESKPTVVSTTGGEANKVINKIAGLLKSGENTPQEVADVIIKNNLENTPEGRNALKAVAQAQETGHNLVVENPGPIESSVVQIIDSKNNTVEFKTISKGQLKQFDDAIDNTQTGIGHQIIDGKTYSITAKTPEQMVKNGAVSSGQAKLEDIPKKSEVIPSETKPGEFTTQKAVTPDQTVPLSQPAGKIGYNTPAGEVGATAQPKAPQTAEIIAKEDMVREALYSGDEAAAKALHDGFVAEGNALTSYP